MPDYREHGWPMPPHLPADEECSGSHRPQSRRHPAHALLRADDYAPDHSPDLAERCERLVQWVSRWSGPVLLGLAFLGLGWLVTRG